MWQAAMRFTRPGPSPVFESPYPVCFPCLPPPTHLNQIIGIGMKLLDIPEFHSAIIISSCEPGHQEKAAACISARSWILA
ncbi:uncharacterized protein LOC144089899 isoform X2 [Stigmatopora argus]